jgi:PAS domain S-box-containing protein
MNDKEKNKKERDFISLPDILWRYKDSDLILAYKVRFIFYFCLSCLITIALVILYSMTIQLSDPLFNSLHYPVIIAETITAVIFCVIIVILIKGYFSAAANLLIITSLVAIWIIIYIDRSDAVTRLDTVVYIFAAISMVPLVILRSLILLAVYVLINIPVLSFIILSQRSSLNISDAAVYDFIADVSMALIFICIILWNVFFINNKALHKLQEEILEKEAAERDLQRNRDEVSSLLRFQNEMLETAAVWINTLDQNDNLISWNKAAERISGYSKEEVLGHGKIWEWLYPDENYRNKIYAKAAAIISSGERVENFETIITRKDGEQRIITWNSNNLIDDAGEPVGSIALGSDITERKIEQDEKEKLEEQIRQMQKMDSIGRLAGGIAHDFNNLLTAILGTSELALLHMSPDDRLHHNFTVIRKAAESGANLTRQLLLFSHKQIMDPKIMDLNDVIEHMRGMLTRMIGENIDFRILPYDNPCRIKADAGQIEQIIINLVVNSRDAMPDGGTLTLETGKIVFDEEYCRYHAQVFPGEYIMLAVSDSGCGMNRNIQEHIYEPFFTTKESGKGTGLGLATVYGAVKQSGGSIELYSEEGLGTTFKLYFPCVTEEINSFLKPEFSDDLPFGEETILVVEDNPYVLDFVSSIVRHLNYKILTAVSGENAITISENYDGVIDLMITDVILTGINGRMLADKISEKRPEMKILYISGYTGDLISRSGILEEGIHFISKPFSGYDLAHKIRSILDQG